MRFSQRKFEAYLGLRDSDIKAIKRAKIQEILAEVGIHRDTFSRWQRGRCPGTRLLDKLRIKLEEKTQLEIKLDDLLER